MTAYDAMLALLLARWAAAVKDCWPALERVRATDAYIRREARRFEMELDHALTVRSIPAIYACLRGLAAVADMARRKGGEA